MTWDLAIVAIGIVAYALISRRAAGSPLTAPIVFVTFGLAAGGLLSLYEAQATSQVVSTLAEATLVMVLFVDASHIRFAALRREYAVPLRLLGIGLPLTIAAGAALAAVVFPDFDLGAALVLAVALAPTDAALGQAVVSDPRLPSRVSQGLNVESGLNDGICVPLLIVALAIMRSEAGEVSPIATLVEQLGGGAAVGLAVGGLVALLLLAAIRHKTVTGEWAQVATLATAALTYAVAVPLGGSGFIAAFVGGAVFGAVLRHGWPAESTTSADDQRVPVLLPDEVGALLTVVTFVAFGAAVLPQAFDDVSWPIVAYAALSLTVVRMTPVAMAMLGSHARLPTVAFLGWFGPRGLASIVFGVIVLEDVAGIAATGTVLTTIVVTVTVSVYAHGLSASPLAARYARWFTEHPRPAELMETKPVEAHPRPLLGSLHRRRAADL